MPSLDAIPAIRIAMYRVGKRSVWHWVEPTTGEIHCRSQHTTSLQAVRTILASEVEVATQLCGICRDALAGRKLIRSVEQIKSDAAAASASKSAGG